MTRTLRYAHLPMLALLLAGCASQTNLVTGENQRAAYTWAQEVQIGREADQQVVAQFGLYDDAALAAYVNTIGQRVLAASAYGMETTPAEIRNTPFYFKVLDSPVVNAMALPGGYIYVTRGLLAHLENEAQLAMVLGHEVGHVLGRHISRRQAGAQLGQLGLLGAAILGQVVGGANVGQGIAQYGGAGLQLLFLRYSRDDEREADRAGVAYAELAGYDAATGADLFRALERISQVEGSSAPGFLSSHPEPGDRQVTIPQLAAQYDGTAINGEAFLAQIEGVVLGDDPRQGFVENETFYHPDLRMQFDIPRGWRVNNMASAVQIVEPNGRAAIELTFAQESSADAAASALASQQGIQVSDRRNVSLGSRAVRVEGAANTQQGQLGFVAYFIEDQGRVYRFTGIAPAAQYASYRSTMDGSIGSFRRLTDSRFLNRQPVRLDVTEAPRTASFSSFLQGRPTPYGMDATRLAIMNQVEPGTSVPAGTELKLPE
jgi:predicted Zn-dependent protease